MEPRPVDERDTQWEREEFAVRILLYDADLGRSSAYDADGVGIRAAVKWARDHAERWSVGIRTTDDDGRPGLLWVAASNTRGDTGS